MSGIAGILNLDGQPVDPQLLKRMTDAMAHRGPDAEGSWVDGSVGLGHRLLQTTPESLHERQPFASDDGKSVIVCDGRIDNRSEFTAALGAPLRTDTDVELILRAYERWGPDCPAHLIGDFAFAIWDRRHHRLFCARDPIGMKPFYYSWDGQRLVFASESKALLAVGVAKKANDAMIADYLLADFRDPEATFFEGIKQLPPAHLLCVERRQLRRQRYWDPAPAAPRSSQLDDDYFERFQALLREAVQCRLRTHRPLGMLLSGGADSMSVATLVETLRHTPSVAACTALTVLYEGFLQSEWGNIQRLIAQHGTAVSTIRPKVRHGFLSYNELFSPFDTFESPFIVGIFAHPFLYEPVRARGCRVLLTGFGADELEQPSESGILKDLLRAGRLTRLVREIRKMACAYETRACDIAVELRDQTPRRIRWLIRTIRGRQVPPWISSSFARRMGLRRRLPARPVSRFPMLCQQESWRMLTMPAMVLHLNELDLIASSAGIEWRHPYLDRRLIEWFLSIPFAVKLRAGYHKPFTRSVLSHLLPRPTEQEVGEFVSSREGPRARALEAQQIEQALSPFRGPLFQYVAVNELKRMIQVFGNDERLRTPLWYVVHLKRWLDRFFPESRGLRDVTKGLQPSSLVTEGAKVPTGGAR